MSEPNGAASEVSEIVDLLKRYLLQETVAPLKSMARTLGFGAAAAVALGIGGVFILIGVLRVLETETGTIFTGDLSWAPYGLTILAGFAIIGIAGAGLLRTPRSERATASVTHRQEAG